jgi:hypothetical protein
VVSAQENNMLEWFGDEAVRIRVAFSKVFGSRWRPFGSAALQLGGLSDGRDGVQWNVAYDPRDGRRWVGVNLEGMQYDDWPVARLLERERRDPELLDLVRNDQGLHPVVVVWRRDYWQATSRPFIQERNIAPTPIALGDLTEEGWRQALEEAYACLDGRRKHRGRAVQTVTLANGDQVQGEVSPHLMFRYFGPGDVEWEQLFREGKERMQPLYDWARRRAARPVTF